jgi:hypothetical protein
MKIILEMTQQEINALNDIVDYVLLDARDNQFYYAQAQLLHNWIINGGTAHDTQRSVD